MGETDKLPDRSGTIPAHEETLRYETHYGAMKTFLRCATVVVVALIGAAVWLGSVVKPDLVYVLITGAVGVGGGFIGSVVTYFFGSRHSGE